MKHKKKKTIDAVGHPPTAEAEKPSAPPATIATDAKPNRIEQQENKDQPAEMQENASQQSVLVADLEKLFINIEGQLATLSAAGEALLGSLAQAVLGGKYSGEATNATGTETAVNNSPSMKKAHGITTRGITIAAQLPAAKEPSSLANATKQAPPAANNEARHATEATEAKEAANALVRPEVAAAPMAMTMTATAKQKDMLTYITSLERMHAEYKDLLKELHVQGEALKTEEAEQFFTNFFKHHHEESPVTKNIFFELIEHLVAAGHELGDYEEVLAAARQHARQLMVESLRALSAAEVVHLLSEEQLAELYTQLEGDADTANAESLEPTQAVGAPANIIL